MGQCQWGHNDCKREGESCSSCLLEDFFYAPKNKPKTMLKHKTNAPDGRMGSKFEYANHKSNEALVSTSMTLNSGATGKEKGDEQIRGIVEVMEELKTQMPDRVGGTKSFSIQRKWLNKLNKEAQEENKEFWYLKFAFSEDEGCAGQIFVVTEQDMIMSMVATMIRDRKIAAEAQAKIDLYQKKYEEQQSKVVALKAELEKVQAELNFVRINENMNQKLPDFEFASTRRLEKV